ncbi:hypothetical protein F5Y10DRAFT_292423 [Nemania abortiva]|nr:hypothetical protein F5Y10DRAFT_292423 [Nemania abortiva]
MNRRVHDATCHNPITKATFEIDGRLPVWAPNNLYADLIMKYFDAEPRYFPQIGPKALGPKIEPDRDGRCSLFGHYPAIDVLQLARNEGVERKEPLDILFVQPDDLRDVIKTIVDFPDNASAPLNILIIDDITPRHTRNFLLLLMAVTSNDPDLTAECAASFWYSHYIPLWCNQAIRDLIGPYTGECNPRDQAESESLVMGRLSRTFQFDKGTLEVWLNDDVWSRIGNEGENGNLDHREKMMLRFPPVLRNGRTRYIDAAQVTPFENHCHPMHWPPNHNPFIIYGGAWPSGPDTDPLRGWDLAAVNNYNAEMVGATNDIYGKMFFYVRDLFKRFVLKLQTTKVRFRVLPLNGNNLTPSINQKFDRIETGSRADENLVGVRTVVNTLAPLLKPATVNPHATMITIHPGVFDKIQSAPPCPECDPDRADRIKQAVTLTQGEINLLNAYLPLPSNHPIGWIFTTVGWQRRDARWLFRDPEAAWKLFKDIYKLDTLAEECKVAMRASHKVVDEWILRLKDANRLDADGRPTSEAQQDFDLLFATGQYGGYRYVEWRALEPHEKSALTQKNKKERTEKQKSQCCEPSHRDLSAEGLAEFQKKGAKLETWLGKDNCENWTPY